MVNKKDQESKPFSMMLFTLGTSFIEKIFSVIVISRLIMIIGLSAAPSALNNAGIKNTKLGLN